MTAITPDPQGSKVGMSSNIGTSFGYLSNAPFSSDPEGVQLQIQSTDNTNDIISGNGLQKVRIVYYDTSWGLNEEILSMNGTTPVLTAGSNIQRIDAIESFQVGNYRTPQGTITLTSLDGNTIFGQIDPIFTVFTQAILTVPPGRSASMLDVSVSCTTTGGIIFVIFKEVDNTSNGGGIVSIPHMIFSALNSNTTMELVMPLTCDATQSSVGLRMGIGVKGLAASQAGSGSFHYTFNN